MKLLRIKDNSQQKKDAFSQVARLTGKIADKTLEQLEREGVFVFPETVKDAEDITQDQMILQSVNDTYRSGNVMGFLGYGDERLVIASRFCGEGGLLFPVSFRQSSGLSKHRRFGCRCQSRQSAVQFSAVSVSVLPQSSDAEGLVQKVYPPQVQ